MDYFGTPLMTTGATSYPATGATSYPATLSSSSGFSMGAPSGYTSGYTLGASLPMASSMASYPGLSALPSTTSSFPTTLSAPSTGLPTTYSAPTTFSTSASTFPPSFNMPASTAGPTYTFSGSFSGSFPSSTLTPMGSVPTFFGTPASTIPAMPALEKYEGLTKDTGKQSGPIVISYFPVKAMGLYPMLVAAVAGIPIEWKKIQMEDWGAMKDSTPFGQLPTLEHGDIKIAQSTAIAAYLGKLGGLLGTDDPDFAVSQMLVGIYEDMMKAFTKCWYGNNRQADTDEYWAEKLPVDLGRIEKLVAGGFTNERTIGELAIFAFLNIQKDMQPECLAAFPALSAFYAHLEKVPKVAAFLAGDVGNAWYKKDW